MKDRVDALLRAVHLETTVELVVLRRVRVARQLGPVLNLPARQTGRAKLTHVLLGRARDAPLLARVAVTLLQQRVLHLVRLLQAAQEVYDREAVGAAAVVPRRGLDAVADHAANELIIIKVNKSFVQVKESVLLTWF